MAMLDNEKMSDVYLWIADLDQLQGGFAQYQSFLSADEYARAGRFRFHHDRVRFVSARGLLRAILATHLDTEPNLIRFSAPPGEKPQLLQTVEGSQLRFSLARTSDSVLIGVTRGREIGVDLEHTQSSIDIETTAPAVFSKHELRLWYATPPERRRELFFIA